MKEKRKEKQTSEYLHIVQRHWNREHIVNALSWCVRTTMVNNNGTNKNRECKVAVAVAAVGEEGAANVPSISPVVGFKKKPSTSPLVLN